MDYSRLEMGEVKINISTFRLNEVVDDAVTGIGAGGNRLVIHRSSYAGLIGSDKYSSTEYWPTCSATRTNLPTAAR